MCKLKTVLVVGEIIRLKPYAKKKTFELIPGYILKKANICDVDYISNEVNKYCRYYLHYEFEKKKGDKNRYARIPNKKDWNYWVIECNNTTNYDRDLVTAIKLSKSNLTIVFQIFYNKNLHDTPGFGYNMIEMNAIFTNLYQQSIEPLIPTDFNIKEKEEIEYIHSLITKFNGKKENYFFLSNAIDMFMQLVRIPEVLTLRTLTIFSILELLLTHKPKIQGQEDSLTHQLKTKILLLNNRFSEKIDFGKEFNKEKKESKEVAIISKLYQYRSNLAHGESTDFNSGYLEALENPPKIQNFLYRLLKKVIIQALKEPEFIRDLRNC